jgi:hypothetical protein
MLSDQLAHEFPTIFINDISCNSLEKKYIFTKIVDVPDMKNE